MAKKKKSTSTSVAPRKSYSAPKRKTRRTKSGVSQIPAAGVSVGLAVANKDAIMNVVNSPSVDSVKNSVKYAMQPEQIKKDIVYAGVGLAAGAAIKKFAPKFIKTPLGKVAKKIPKVI